MVSGRKPGRVCRNTRRVLRLVSKSVEWSGGRGTPLSGRRTNEYQRLVPGRAFSELFFRIAHGWYVVCLSARGGRRTETYRDAPQQGTGPGSPFFTRQPLHCLHVERVWES